MSEYTTRVFKSLPIIDLHGLDRDTARIRVNEFIKDNRKLKKKVIVVNHGKGSGILKKEVHLLLKNHKSVINYYIDMFNDGDTIVELKIWQSSEKVI